MGRIIIPYENDALMHYGRKGQEWYQHKFGKYQGQAEYASGSSSPSKNPGSRLTNGLRNKNWSGDSFKRQQKAAKFLVERSDDEHRGKAISNYLNTLSNERAQRAVDSSEYASKSKSTYEKAQKKEKKVNKESDSDASDNKKPNRLMNKANKYDAKSKANQDRIAQIDAEISRVLSHASKQGYTAYITKRTVPIATTKNNVRRMLTTNPNKKLKYSGYGVADEYQLTKESPKEKATRRKKQLQESKSDKYGYGKSPADMTFEERYEYKITDDEYRQALAEKKRKKS